MKMSSFLCDRCPKTFTQKCNLARHVKFVHDGNNNGNYFVCYHCDKKFQRKYYLVRHINNFHSAHGHNAPRQSAQSQNGKTYSCPMCNFSAHKIEIVQHYHIAHGVDISVKSASFLMVSDFVKWKTEFELETCSKYINHKQKKWQNKGETKMKYFYRCHRDGFYKPKGKNLRALKIMGSNKIDGHCPAKIVLSIFLDTGKASIKYCESHVGHKIEKGPDKLFDSLNSLNKGELTKKMSMLRKRHKASITLLDQIIMEDNGTWIVSSASGTDLYQIKSSIEYMSCNCNIKCIECGICIHSYQCSCMDSSIMWNMCKHIHLLGMFLKNGPTTTKVIPQEMDELSLDCNPDGNQEEYIVLKNFKKNPLDDEFLLKKPPPDDEFHDLENLEMAKSNLMQNVNDIMSMIKSIEDCEVFAKALAPLPHVFSSKSNSSNMFMYSESSLDTPANKIVECQRWESKDTFGRQNEISEDIERVPELKFLSAKKKNFEKKNSLKKHSNKEKNFIAMNLLPDISDE